MRGWIALAGLADGLLFGFIARAVDGSAANALFFVSGLGFLVAIVIGIGMLQFWAKIGLRLPPAGPLFVRPGPGEVWSPEEGKPVPKAPVPKSASKRSRTKRS